MIELYSFQTLCIFQRKFKEGALSTRTIPTPSATDESAINYKATRLRWLPRVIMKHPPYRARVMKGNVVNFA